MDLEIAAVVLNQNQRILGNNKGCQQGVQCNLELLQINVDVLQLQDIKLIYSSSMLQGVSHCPALATQCTLEMIKIVTTIGGSLNTS